MRIGSEENRCGGLVGQVGPGSLTTHTRRGVGSVAVLGAAYKVDTGVMVDWGPAGLQQLPERSIGSRAMILKRKQSQDSYPVELHPGCMCNCTGALSDQSTGLYMGIATQ